MNLGLTSVWEDAADPRSRARDRRYTASDGAQVPLVHRAAVPALTAH